MKMRKSYRYLANDEKFDLESDSNKANQLHAEKSVVENTMRISQKLIELIKQAG